MKEKNTLMSLGEFLRQRKEFGGRIAFTNWLICFTKWYAGAKRIRLEYPNKRKAEDLIKSKQENYGR